MGEFEWYALDSSLRRASVIEGFKSFIWTERYSAYGDFQLITPSTYDNRKLLVPETYLGMNLSDYVMKIDTVSDETADDGTRLLTVTGNSLEALLKDRVAFNMVSDTTTNPDWILAGTPEGVIQQLFLDVCVNGAISQLDTIPFYHLGPLNPPGNIPLPLDQITVSFQPGYLYDAIKQLADQYFLGFRLVKNGELGQVYFEVYTGNDLTTDQFVKPPVVFDPTMENLKNIKVLTSTAIVKTVAYVYAQNGSAIVYGPDYDQTASGAGRRVLLVSSSNSNPAGDDLTAALQHEGLQALAAQRNVYAFDGQLPESFSYVYGRDYNLGDLVEERNDGLVNQMLVTEQIFSKDETGEKSYPTLTLFQGITPGTWQAQPPTEFWTDFADTTHWSDL
jgi:hypothetical protein